MDWSSLRFQVCHLLRGTPVAAGEEALDRIGVIAPPGTNLYPDGARRPPRADRRAPAQVPFTERSA